MTRPAFVDDTPEDARWRRLQGDLLAGEGITAEDAAFLGDYRPVGAVAREEARVLAAIRAIGGLGEHGELCEHGEHGEHGESAESGESGDGRVAERGADGDRERDSAGDERLIAAAIDRALGPAPASLAARRGRGRAGIVAGVGVLLAIAAAWAIMIRPMGQVSSDMFEGTALKVAAARRGLAEALGAGDQPIVLLRGALTDAAPQAIGSALAEGPVRVDAGTCVGVRGALRACAEEPAALVVRGAILEVRGGVVRVDVLGPAVNVAWTRVGAYAIRGEGPGSYTVTIVGERWELRAEGAAAVVEGDGGVFVRVGAGAARSFGGAKNAGTIDSADSLIAETSAGADSENGDTAGDASGEVEGAPEPADSGAASGEPSVRPTRPAARAAEDPASLLREAQALRGAGSFAAAARAYRKVIAADPRGPLARTSQVALGQLYAGPLADPKAALRAFDAYLKGGDGAMSEEALYGKVTVLDRLGRREAADAAAGEFLRRFPGSRYAAGVRGR